MKKAIVIYDTKFGNTEKIAKSLAEGIRTQEFEVNSVKVDQIDVNGLVEYDFLAIGGPTHAFGISKPMKNFLEKIKNVNVNGKKAFVFDTKMKAWWAGSAGKGIEKRLKKFGMIIIHPYHSAIVEGNEGPLEKGSENKFKQIGAELILS